MKKIILSAVLFWGFSIMANASDNLSINVTSSQPSFIVSLAANPTTGYQWSAVKFDKDLLTLTSSKYQKPNTKLIGAGGQMLFTFTLNKGKTYPKETNMVFKYARSWEPESGTVKNITVNFVAP